MTFADSVRQLANAMTMSDAWTAAAAADPDAEGTHGPVANLIHSHRHRHADGTWRNELHGHDDEEHQAHASAAAAKSITFSRGTVKRVPQDKQARREMAAQAYERAFARRDASLGGYQPGVAYASCWDMFNDLYGRD
jgi:hypothetical protein